MDIILIEDISHLGAAGEMLTVKAGYARNYLIPRGFAIEATKQNVKTLDHQKRIVQAQLQKRQRAAEQLAKQIEEISCTVTKPVGEEDKLFGAVTSTDIHTSLAHEGIEIDRKKIILDEPIKSLGIFTVPIKVHPEVTANLKVWVVKE